jgi:hypothetical protein
MTGRADDHPGERRARLAANRVKKWKRIVNRATKSTTTTHQEG